MEEPRRGPSRKNEESAKREEEDKKLRDVLAFEKYWRYEKFKGKAAWNNWEEPIIGDSYNDRLHKKEPRVASHGIEKAGTNNPDSPGGKYKPTSREPNLVGSSASPSPDKAEISPMMKRAVPSPSHVNASVTPTDPTLSPRPSRKSCPQPPFQGRYDVLTHQWTSPPGDARYKDRENPFHRWVF